MAYIPDIPEDRLKALYALMRSAQGRKVADQINANLGALLVKAESHTLHKHIDNVAGKHDKHNIKEKELAR